MSADALQEVNSRLERLEQENKALKQWVGKLRQENEKLTQRFDLPTAHSTAPSRMPTGQYLLTWGMVVGLVLAGMTVYRAHGRLDELGGVVRTREIHVVNEDGDIGVSLHHSKEHGPRLFMNETISRGDFSMSGPKRIMMAVAPDGRPSLHITRHAKNPSPFEAGEVGLVLGTSKADYPEILVANPFGKACVYLGTNNAKQPTIEVIDAEGKPTFRVPLPGE